MTHSPAEVELTPAAATRLEDYLQQVRAALAGTTDVNADEIEADIREHVENELRAAPSPVSVAALEAVLMRLGPPSQWGSTDDPTFIHRAKQLLREKIRGAKSNIAGRVRGTGGVLWRGPEDWRLAYLSFGIFSLGILTFFALFPITLIVSYFLSRAGIAYANERGIALGAARKWLLYPPVVIVSTALLIAVMAWPVIFGGIAHAEISRVRNRVERFDASPPPAPRRLNPRTEFVEVHESSQLEEDRKLLASIPITPEWAPAVAGWFVAAGSVGLWWTLLGVFGMTYPGAIRAVFYPLCNHFERRHASWLVAACIVVLVPWGLATYEFVAGLIRA